MLYNSIPFQRKLSVLFSQGRGRHLAAGRTACAQDQQRQLPFSKRMHHSKRSPGHMWHLTPTCANWHLATRKHTAVGMPFTITSAQLCGAGSSPPKASKNSYHRFPHFTGWLEHAEAELQPLKEGSKPPVQHSPSKWTGSNESLPWPLSIITFPLHVFRSITFTTVVIQISAEQRWIATLS